MATPRLLFIEDDQSLREAVTVTLSRAGYEVHAEADGTNLAGTVTAFRPDLAILDVWLPGGRDGFALATELRTLVEIPIVFVTAADAIEQRLRGFEVGADDYILKPFVASELLARVRAVLRRSGRLTSPTYQVFDLLVDEENRTASRGGHDLGLTKLEFDLLSVLSKEPGKVFSKTQLLSLVWGFAGYDNNLVEVHVSALRRKLEAHGGRLIHTERGEGYVLRGPVGT
ncbi:MAG TPA: response regulator transcription factor [Acidimicrobiia bacterium]|nr:response regulator transcription factor [Acidimicrobiia bacterium]